MADFKINKDKEDDGDYREVAVYTFMGKHDVLDATGFPILACEEDIFSHPDAYAVKIIKGERTNYWVRRNKRGALFNPIGLYSEGNSQKRLRHAGRPEWRLEPTSVKVFDFYVNFLKSKNSAWLNNAEREV